MAQTQEFMVSCGTSKIPAHLLMERTRIPSGPPPSETPQNQFTGWADELEPTKGVRLVTW